MEGIILSAVYSEEGIPFYYGYLGEEKRLYRWEPVATRLYREEAGNFRRRAAKRAWRPGETPEETGLLPVAGPLSYRGEKLLGWEARPGEPLFSKLPLSLPAAEIFHLLLPLFQSYLACHRRGLIVGPPDWRRIFLDTKGVFMPDPLLLSYLATPRRFLPPRPSRLPPAGALLRKASGTPGSKRGPFLPGPLSYLVFTGHLPYPLIRGWPTEALRQGIIIPPSHFRPDLPAVIGQDLERLLAVNPEARPEVDEIIDRWRQLKKAQFFVAAEKKRKSRAWWEKGRLYFRLYWSRWGKTALLLGSLLMINLFSFLCWRLGKEAGAKKPALLPAEGAAAILEQLADPAFPTAFFPGDPELWADVKMMKEERRAAAAAMLTHPLLEVAKVIPLWQDSNNAEVEVELLWYRWREGGWQTVVARERLQVVRRGKRWAIIGRRRLD